VTTPPDVLCKWLPAMDRWETMEELAYALEIEAGLWTRQEVEQTETLQYVERMMELTEKKRSGFAA